MTTSNAPFQMKGELSSMSTISAGLNSEDLVRICWYYYKLGMTQAEIAHRMKTNRARVMRALETALSEGIVEIRVKHPIVNLLEIEQDLLKKLPLKNILVVPTDEVDSDNLNQQLGMAAAQHISSSFHDGDILAIGWGDSVSQTIRHLSLDEYKDFYLVSLTGGLLPQISEWRFFGKYLQRLKVLPSPLIVSNQRIARAIFEEPEAAGILRMWDMAQHALVGIGAISERATIVQRGYISEVDVAMLRQSGAVGDVLGHFLDADGNPIPYETDKRLVSQSLAGLRSMKNVIGIAGGLAKLDAIKAVVNGGYIHMLITDEFVARRLLET